MYFTANNLDIQVKELKASEALYIGEMMQFQRTGKNKKKAKQQTFMYELLARNDQREVEKFKLILER